LEDFDSGKYEAALMLFNGKHPEICEDEDGVPQIFVSDGERHMDDSIGFDVSFTPECRRATLVVTHTDPNTAAIPPSFSIGGVILSMEVPEVPDNEVIPPGEPGPWHPGSVASGLTSSNAPLICYSDETVFSSYAASPGGTRYAGIWVPAGQSVTFDVSGQILPTTYFSKGRGQFEYHVRVRAGDQLLYDDWNFASTPVLDGDAPWPWEPLFAPRRIGTWQNSTGTNQVFLIETEAKRTYAGAATRWNIHVTGGDGSGAPGCG
jgi:hypothetical protein